MGYTYYKTSLLIPDRYELTFSDLVEKIKKRFSKMIDREIEISGTNTIILHHGEWFLDIYWEDEPHVLIESEEIARLFASDRSDRSTIAACSRRITTAGQPDPNMNYFNDYVYVLEVLEGMPGLFVFDSHAGKIQKTE